MNEKTPKLLDDIRDQARFILSITADKSLAVIWEIGFFAKL
jgi:hypothetical protein